VIVGGTQVLVVNDAATVVIASHHECVVGDDVQYVRMTPKMQMTIFLECLDRRVKSNS
jgi:hypothetical protein